MSEICMIAPSVLNKNLLKDRLSFQLYRFFVEQEEECGEMPDDVREYIPQHNFFVDNVIENFESIFRFPITDMNIDSVRVRFDPPDDYLRPLDKYNYLIKMNNNQYEVCCMTYREARKLLINEAIDYNLFLYNPTYVYGFLKPEYKTIKHKHIEYPEPDLDCDEEEHPLFDTDDCPCCMERFGITEKQELIGNHPNKKILKTTKTICVKRNTYCGHPICIDCFKTICNSNAVRCPMCRTDYEETGDVEIIEHIEDIDMDTIEEMMKNEDDMLMEMVDIESVIDQSVLVDGYTHLLHIEGFINDNDPDFFFGVQE